jgi:hypothetical protein
LFLEAASVHEISEFPRLNAFLEESNSIEMPEAITVETARVVSPFRFDLEGLIGKEFLDKLSESGPMD